MPRISQFYGIAIYMYYRDHAPPHFHAIYGEFETTVEIATTTRLDGQIPPKAWLLVREWAQMHRDELNADWEFAEVASPSKRLTRYNKDRGTLMIMRIIELQVVGPHVLKLTFNNGTRKTVDVYPLLQGPVFEPLKDPAYFASVELDPIAGTVVWPNKADLAPEALHDLIAAEETTTAKASHIARPTNTDVL